MPTVGRLSRLFQSINVGDLTQAKILADEIIADEERKGHHNAAKLLRGSLRPNGRVSEHSERKMVGHNGQINVISGALSAVNEPVVLSDVMLKDHWRKELDNILKEWRNREHLASVGINHRSKLFLYGPPGCGKSMTARAIGCELSLPTYIRGNPLDVGELDRIVISLMQELEHCRAKGIIVATSNLPKHLDGALWRRFDAVIEFPNPSKNELLKYARGISSHHSMKLSETMRKKLCKARSYADAEEMVKSAARSKALQGL